MTVTNLGMPRVGFFTDTSVCIGCKACEVACKEWNAIPADGALDLTGEDMDALNGRPGVRLLSEPEFRTFSIKMNTRHGPLMDVELRRAVSYAFNYQGMLDAFETA